MTDDFPTAMAELIDAVASSVPLPRDRIDTLLAMTTIAGTGPSAVSARRFAAIAMAAAATEYEPNSYDDAVQVMTLVATALDDQITVAGDAGQDDTYLALRTLRAAVVDDLTSRGANLAPLVRVQRGVALPSLVLAQQFYADGGRAEELVRRIVPRHPAFISGDLLVLAR